MNIAYDYLSNNDMSIEEILPTIENCIICRDVFPEIRHVEDYDDEDIDLYILVDYIDEHNDNPLNLTEFISKITDLDEINCKVKKGIYFGLYPDGNTVIYNYDHTYESAFKVYESQLKHFVDKCFEDYKPEVKVKLSNKGLCFDYWISTYEDNIQKQTVDFINDLLPPEMEFLKESNYYGSYSEGEEIELCIIVDYLSSNETPITQQEFDDDILNVIYISLDRTGNTTQFLYNRDSKLVTKIEDIYDICDFIRSVYLKKLVVDPKDDCWTSVPYFGNQYKVYSEGKVMGIKTLNNFNRLKLLLFNL